MQVSLADIFQITVRWRRLILINFVLFVLVSIAVAFLLPKKYTSTATILPPEGEGGSELGFLSMLTDIPVNIPSLPGIVTPADEYLAILRSRNVREAVIKNLKLKEYFEVTFMTDALLQLNNISFFDKTEENLVVISVTERTPELAQKIVQSFVDELDRVNQETRKTSATYSREFLEKRLREVEDNLQTAAENIREFQEKNKAISLEEQTKTAIEAAAKLRGEIALNEVELNLLEKSLEPTHSEVINKKFQLQELQKQLDKLETGKGLKDSDFVIPFSQIPDLGKQYVFLTKDLEVYKAIYTLLTQQYEQAKLQEKKDTPTLKILDKPNLPDKKSKPQRRLIVMISAILSLFVSLFMISFNEYIFRLKTADNKKYAKIVDSWTTLRNDFRLKKKTR